MEDMGFLDSFQTRAENRPDFTTNKTRRTHSARLERYREERRLALDIHQQLFRPANADTRYLQELIDEASIVSPIQAACGVQQSANGLIKRRRRANDIQCFSSDTAVRLLRR